MAFGMWIHLWTGSELAWQQQYHSQVAGTGNLSPLLRDQVVPKVAGTGPIPRLIGPAEM